jgi:glucose-6-phosphate 1-epimerase
MSRVELLATDGARAELCRHGAHVTSWIPEGSASDQLFLSARSSFNGDTAIRGGVPVIFPQFAGMGPLPKHGFARTTEWELTRIGVTATGGASAALRLTDSTATHAIWPHAFVAEVTVAIRGRSLTVTLAVENTGAAPFSFTGALHTYVRVDDIARVTVHGLTGVRYRDSAAGNACMDGDDPLHIDGYIDRIYLGAVAPIEVREPGRAIRVSMSGFSDVVVWNPGAERGAALTDLEPQGFRRMLCVEAAVVETPVLLPAGGRWAGAQTLTAL